jgi:crotonobetainyl-CoA:carnitine CoA-transferase CaiB-like acyl-CoA transferase
MTALTGFTIVELANGVCGEYCGKLLADFGAEVVKVEQPLTGSPTRSMAPVVREEAGVEGSGLFAYLNTNKTSVTLDLAAPADVERLHELIAGADAIIDDHGEAWMAGVGLGAETREMRHPHAVFCSIRPFGERAPADWESAKSLNVFHASGWGYHTPTSPDLDRPPLKGAGRFLVDYDAALDAALCIAASLYWRGRGGRGQSIELSQQEVLISRADCVLGRMLAGEDEPRHARDAYDMKGPAAAFACRDGFVYLVILHRGHWAAMAELMGGPSWMKDFPDDWLEFGVTPERVERFRGRFADWVATRGKDEVSEEAQRLGVPLVPVNDASDVQRSAQFVHRRFFQPLEHPALGKALYPTVPYKLSASPARLARPAPRLGEHTAARLAARRAPPAERRLGEPAKSSRGGPLAGVRVLEIAKVWAGPYAGKLLAYLGAEVIKVESNSTLDEMRGYGGVDANRAPYFLSLNPEVLSVQVNMKSPEGLGYLRQMIARSDVVLNNIRPGAMERLGLGYDGLRKIRPDIIAVSLKMYGAEGPLAHQSGYAPCFAALGGLNYLVGYEGEPPRGMNMRYGDSTVGAATAFATVAALLHRERTGEGQFVDVSAVETMASLVGDSLLEYSLTGRIPVAEGDRDPAMAPHGCYPCAGGEWISIAVGSDAEWRGVCSVLDDARLADGPRFASAAGRQANAAVLDQALAAATKAHDADALGARLRAAGVAAFKSLSSLDLIADERLWAREVFRLVSDDANGSRPVIGAPWRMSRAQAEIARGAPRLGEHNAYVYGELLGLSREQLDELIRRGIVD